MTNTTKEAPSPNPGADELQQACEAIDRLAQHYRHMVRASAALRAAANMVTQTAMYERQCADLREQIGAQEAALIRARQAVAESEQRATEILAQAHADVEAARQRAREEAAEIVSAARMEADRAASAAARAIATRQAEADAALADIRGECELAGRQTQALRLEAARLAGEIETLETRLVDARRAAAAIINPQDSQEKQA